MKVLLAGMKGRNKRRVFANKRLVGKELQNLVQNFTDRHTKNPVKHVINELLSKCGIWNGVTKKNSETLAYPNTKIHGQGPTNQFNIAKVTQIP